MTTSWAFVLIMVALLVMTGVAMWLLSLLQRVTQQSAKLSAAHGEVESLQEQRYQLVCSLNHLHVRRVTELQAANGALVRFIQRQDWHPPDDADWWKSGGNQK